MIIRFECDLVDLGSINGPSTALLRVSEDQLVGLGTNYIPSVAARSERGGKVGNLDLSVLVERHTLYKYLHTSFALVSDLECGSELIVSLSIMYSFATKGKALTFFMNP